MRWGCDLSRMGIGLLAGMMLLIAISLPAYAYVNVSADEDAEVYGANIDGFYVWEDYSADGVDGVATVSYNYPAAPGNPGDYIIGTDSVSGRRELSAYAHADESAGIMRAYSYSWLNVWGEQVDHISVVAHARAEVEIRERFVLSDAATITLSGLFEGALGGDSELYDYYESWDPAEAGLQIRFQYYDGSEAGVQQGVSYGFDSPGDFYEAFSEEIALPADVEIQFYASLYAESAASPNISWILDERGITTPGQLTGVAGSTWVNLTNTALFTLQVPEGVTLTSTNGSELFLPVEVQTVPEPSALLALASGLSVCGLSLFRRRK